MSKRRTLTPSELTFARICMEHINPELLAPHLRPLFASLASQFSWDCRLSDAQLCALKRLKLASDLRKRSDAIAGGRITYNDAARTDAKLNTVYNKIGRPD